jgi:hypothetical protein
LVKERHALVTVPGTDTRLCREWVGSVTASSGSGYPVYMADAERTFEEQLEEIGAQLVWVRDYL